MDDINEEDDGDMEDLNDDYGTEEDFKDPIKCKLRNCENNDDGECLLDEIDEPEPNNRFCKGYDFMFKDGAVLDFKDEDELNDFLSANSDIQHLVIDEDSLRVKCMYHKINDSEKVAIIQVSEENEKAFDFRPSVEGGFIAIDRNQLDLFQAGV